jgi:hypothetical protein
VSRPQGARPTKKQREEKERKKKARDAVARRDETVRRVNTAARKAERKLGRQQKAANRRAKYGPSGKSGDVKVRSITDLSLAERAKYGL